MATHDLDMATDRLLLSPWRRSEAGALLAIRSIPNVAKWLGDPTVWTDIGEAEAAIEAWDDKTRNQAPLGNWAIRPDDGPPIGNVSMSRVPSDVDDEIEIGWYLHPDATGSGYAREAAAAVLARALEAGIERVWAIMWPHNEASASVALAIGMTDLGVVDDPWYGTEEEPTSRMFRAERVRSGS